MLHQGIAGNQRRMVLTKSASPRTEELNKMIYFFMKRILDVTMATAILLVFAPVMIIIAILIKLDSPGPVFFVQERVGARRRSNRSMTFCEAKNFNMYKFRSMRTDSDDSIHKEHIKAFVQGTIEESEDEKAKFKISHDPRITRLGAFIRKTSLDELPQLFNVIKGDMSLVGPRPVPVYEVEEYNVWHRERLTTLPGITGLWQIEGRSQVSFQDMIRMDIRYLRNQSLWLDIKIIFLTIPSVLLSRGAK